MVLAVEALASIAEARRWLLAIATQPDHVAMMPYLGVTAAGNTCVLNVVVLMKVGSWHTSAVAPSYVTDTRCMHARSHSDN